MAPHRTPRQRHLPKLKSLGQPFVTRLEGGSGFGSLRALWNFESLMITPEELVGEEWASWYRLSPQERWRESEKLWQVFFYLGGSLDAEPDTQSPFFDPTASRKAVAHGRPGMRILRRRRV